MTLTTLLHPYLSRFATLAALISATSAVAQTIYSEDFERFPADDYFFEPGSIIPAYYNPSDFGDWTQHNWNPNSPTDWGTQDALGNSGNGSTGLFRGIYQGEFWYGGGIFSPFIEVSLPSDNLADYSIWVDLRGFAYDDNGDAPIGEIGVSVLSLDSSNTPTGAVYEDVQISGDWATYTLNFADMRAGVPDNATDGLLFDTSAAKIQIIFWHRNDVLDELGNVVGDYEGGWSSDPTVGTVNTFYVDNVSIVPEPSTYAALAGLGALAWVIVRRRK